MLDIISKLFAVKLEFTTAIRKSKLPLKVTEGYSGILLEITEEISCPSSREILLPMKITA
jgi:hypothetical protein